MAQNDDAHAHFSVRRKRNAQLWAGRHPPSAQGLAMPMCSTHAAGALAGLVQGCCSPCGYPRPAPRRAHPALNPAAPSPADDNHSDIPVPDFTFYCYPETRYANSSWPAIQVGAAGSRGLQGERGEGRGKG